MTHHPNKVNHREMTDQSTLVAEVAAALVSHKSPLAPHVGAFLVEADETELLRRDPVKVADAILAHQALGATRQPGAAAVAIRIPGTGGFGSDRPSVQVVTDDMPFLVDSVSMAIRRCGFDIELLMHPILDHQSWINAELNRTPTDGEAAALAESVTVALADVRAAVEDWPPMQDRARALAADLRATQHLGIAANIDVAEAANFVDWLLLGNFTFLGAVDHSLVGTDLIEDEGSALGIVRAHTGGTPINEVLSPSADWPAEEVVLVTKTMAVSKVHRQGNYDIVIIKRYATGGNPADKPVGERRIIGLFTSEAYLRSPAEVPLLRGKLQNVLDRSGLPPNSHSGKELKSILVSHPRDELFASTTEDLQRTAMGVLAIGERRRTRVFARYDGQRGAWNCQVYLPRDRYTTDVRLRMQRSLETAFAASGSTYTTQLTDARLARIVFTVPSANTESPNLNELESQLSAASQSWADSLADELTSRFGVSTSLATRFRDAFPPAYTAETPLSQAVDDVVAIENALRTQTICVRMHRNSSEDVETADARLSLYSPRVAIALADLLPVLANMGLRVIDEKADEVELVDQTVWVHDLGIVSPHIVAIDPGGPDAARICSAVLAAWNGLVDNDTFNQLVPVAGVTSFEANILRFYARHARQLGLGASLDYVVAALLEHPHLASSLTARFAIMFDPISGRTIDQRTSAAAALKEQFMADLADVPSLDHDRILRMLSAQIDASIRTNAYDPAASALAVKFETRRINEAPLPRPKFEIFVSCPQVEGVHLRMGSVARGGLRWSDRPEDFRTEILGLMKAQAVKNAVIVPAGAKGGFVVRHPTPGADRNVQQQEGIACYQTFIRALLELTDNVVNGAVVPPANVVRWDADDTYLVVAADKGTATFSDIANAISVERGHWLGDAFASGGSVGYDHKVMGITARGAWESVKRHFLRLGRDITAAGAEPFAVAGVGDMSGDVFGNGMLLSDRISLVAAFDHRHIFIDPTPDLTASLAERARLFALPRSSWDDYAKSLISDGGGVWPRTAKSISLSDAALHSLGLPVDGPRDFAPNDVLRAILRAPVDVLWNGGIGTYIKASTETHTQVGDKANDLIRADATELRCAIVGEGGNLGVTQRGRIEFATRLRQEPINSVGWINTDAIDNSAGVDTSDHEVNLKILVDKLVHDGKLPADERNPLLASLTDEVAHLVLADNIDQNRLLGNLYSEGPGMIDLHARYVSQLEADGRLDRALEALPSADGFTSRKAAGAGLTIPELAVLVAHTKLEITEELAEAKLADEPVFQQHLRAYFPSILVDRLGDAVLDHPLRHEILATVLANRLVNHNGTTFAFRMAEETHASVPDIVRAHTAAMNILGIDAYWRSVSTLDGKTADENVVQLFLEADRAVERVSRWLLRNRSMPFDISAAVSAYQPALKDLSTLFDQLPISGPGSDAEALASRLERFTEFGLSPDVARQGAQFEFATGLLDVVMTAETTGHDRRTVGEVHLALDDLLLIGRLRRRVARLPREEQWDSLARSALRDDLAGEHAALTKSVLASNTEPGSTEPGSTEPGSTEPGSTEDRVRAWINSRAIAVARHRELVEQTEGIKSSSLAALSVVLRQLRTLSTERAG
jgi:glutamate dehydrogenase